MNTREGCVVLIRSTVVFATACIMLYAISCTEKSKSEEAPIRQPRTLDSVAVRDSLQRRDSVRLVHRQRAARPIDSIAYHRVYVRNAALLDSIRQTFHFASAGDSAKIIALLNRKELRFMRVGDTLILPLVITKDTRDYSVFPHYYEGAQDVPKLVMVSNEYQCYACYEYGELVRFSACNTGTKGKPTFPGLYHVNWRQIERISSLNEEWILPYTINFHRYAGNAFHQFEMPGRPVSHSCIRQFLYDAKWLYSWVRTPRTKQKGTPIIIVGMFKYARKRGGPWWDLTSNRAHFIALPPEPLKVEEALIPLSQIPKDVRGGLPNKSRYLNAQDTLLARGVIDSTYRLRESIDYNKLRAMKKAKKTTPRQDTIKPSSNITPPSDQRG